MTKLDIHVDAPKHKCSRCSQNDADLGKFVFWHKDLPYEEYWICLECWRKVMEYLGFKK